MLTQLLEAVQMKNQRETLTPESNIPLTTLGQRLARWEKVSYDKFFALSLPPAQLHLRNFLSDLMTKVTQETEKVSKEFPFRLGIRGSHVRRAAWDFVLERSNVPVGNYWAISDWWNKYFLGLADTVELDETEKKVKAKLVSGPSDLDPRLEYYRYRDRELFADFTVHRLPKIVQQAQQINNPDAVVDHSFSIKGVDPFTLTDSGYPTYVGSRFELKDSEGVNAPFLIDFGTANIGRAGLKKAHQVGEPELVAHVDGLALPIYEFYNHQVFTNSFSGKYNGSLFTPLHGLKGLDVVTCGTRQIYQGAFYDPAPTPQFDPTVTHTIRKFKFYYPEKGNSEENQNRKPEIVSNIIVALMADPIYTYSALRQSDYLRQFHEIRWLADNNWLQRRLDNAIEKRMTTDYFLDGVWDPFLIIDAFSETCYPIERSFSGLVKLFGI